MRATNVKGHTRSRKGKGNTNVRRHRRGSSYLTGKGIVPVYTKNGVTFKGDKWPPVHQGMSKTRLLNYLDRLRKEVQKMSDGKHYPSSTHRRFIMKRIQQVSRLLNLEKER